jgi:hypothetical protein
MRIDPENTFSRSARYLARFAIAGTTAGVVFSNA